MKSGGLLASVLCLAFAAGNCDFHIDSCAEILANVNVMLMLKVIK